MTTAPQTLDIARQALAAQPFSVLLDEAVAPAGAGRGARRKGDRRTGQHGDRAATGRVVDRARWLAIDLPRQPADGCRWRGFALLWLPRDEPHAKAPGGLLARTGSARPRGRSWPH